MVDELVMYIVNDGDIYRQRIQPIVKNLKRKQARGIYDPALAVKAFSYAAQDGMKKYSKEFGGLGLQRGEIGKTRMAIASELLSYFEEELAGDDVPDQSGPMGEEAEGLEGGLPPQDKGKLQQLESLLQSLTPEGLEIASGMLSGAAALAEAGEDVAQIKEGEEKDMTGKPCSKKRCSGEYEETSQTDDYDGVLHCDKCGKEVKRWQKTSNPV